MNWFVVDPVTLRPPLDMLEQVHCAPLPLQKFLDPGACLDEDNLAPTWQRRTVDGRKGDKWKTGFSKFCQQIGEVLQLAILTVFFFVGDACFGGRLECLPFSLLLLF